MNAILLAHSGNKAALTMSVRHVPITAAAAALQCWQRDGMQVHSVAKGRLWTGRDAKSIGLVDELGGLAEAVELARKLATKSSVLLCTTSNCIMPGFCMAGAGAYGSLPSQ